MTLESGRSIMPYAAVYAHSRYLFWRKCYDGRSEGPVNHLNSTDIYMARYKTPDFEERAEMARTAKQGALDRLRNKAAPAPEVIAQRQAALAVREASAAERRTARQLVASEAKATMLATRIADSEASDAETSPAELSAPDEAHLKAARDARYAARKARNR